MRYKGVISADIIGSTSLESIDRNKLLVNIKSFLKKIDSEYNSFSRITKGDLIEVYVSKAQKTLRIALLIKTFIKSKTNPGFSFLGPKKPDIDKNKRAEYFKIHGIRMAIAVDTMNKIDRKKGIMEGEAIYSTGRAISESHTYNKNRIVIKNTMQFLSGNKEWESEFDVLIGLVDILLSKATSRQSEIIEYRLMGLSEAQISEKLNISQSAINQASTSVGWRAIEKALNRFEKVIK